MVGSPASASSLKVVVLAGRMGTRLAEETVHVVIDVNGYAQRPWLMGRTFMDFHVC